MKTPPKALGARLLVSAGLLAALIGSLAELNNRFQPVLARGVLPESLLAFLVLALAAAAFAALEIWTDRLVGLRRLRARLPLLAWALAAGLAMAVSALYLYTVYYAPFGGFFTRTFFLAFALLGMGWLLTGGERPLDFRRLLAAGILFGTIFQLGRLFQTAVSYPFALHWSEGNRLWDYSLTFGRTLYNYPDGQPIPSLTDPMRRALWGLPFLLPDPSIVLVRAWSGVVFSLPYALLGWALFRTRSGQAGLWAALGAWSFLFLNQGPIYSPLVLAALLVAVALRLPRSRPGLLAAMLLVAVAGFYARSGRFTWLFAPAIWGSVSAFLQASPEGPLWSLRRWGRPVALGLAGVFGGYLLPELMALPGQPGVSSVSAGDVGGLIGRQPLLWDRLWPNPTYPPGIVLGLLTAVAPVLVLLILALVSRRWRLNGLQIAALAVMLLSFLAVGLIVSVKIGGGSNLHNLDMFLIAILFAAALAWEQGAGERLLGQGRRAPAVGLLLLLAVGLPAAFGWYQARTLELPANSEAEAEQALAGIKIAIEQAEGDGEILFMDQRQLLTFGYVPDVPLVAEYEKKWVMDEAMAVNMDYLEPFYADLVRQRFSLIITEPLRIRFQDRTFQFGNENDSWVLLVSGPVLCYYEPLATYEKVGVQLLVPKAEPGSPDERIYCP